VGRTPFEIVVPVIMYCAMLWWLSRRMSWTRLLAITAVIAGPDYCRPRF